ncbi:uncharacterized protein LOC121737284 isoform X2 [Aricia agestis]|uniref:uncharacterized protein LOC121737284 isoform X2 n=1 Tax=Aricia agestis TaxID=91739 RepID=UPI001C203EAF|nr:uncharacterized protein LOC121737284 isoform X2 [Aricia agestis]
MKTVMIVLLAVVAMASAQGVNVVDNSNPGHVNVVDNNPLGDLILDRNPSQVNVVDHNPQGNGGFAVDQAFYRPVNPSGSGYQQISNGPALVNPGQYQQQPGAYPVRPTKPGTHPGARGGR